ncbi:hypothetical protein GCM10027612_41500 [Microbispora bryophytorum subsp. camponoti]
MLGDVGQPQRLRFLDQQAEQAQPVRPVLDPGDLLLAQPYRYELEEGVLLPDHAHRAVCRVHQRRGGGHDAPQNHLQVEVAADRHDRLQQRVHPIPGGQHRLQTRLQLRQQIIQPHAGNQRRGLLLRHGAQFRIEHLPAPTPRAGGGRREPDGLLEDRKAADEWGGGPLGAESEAGAGAGEVSAA